MRAPSSDGVREALALADDETMMVSELTCPSPGAHPLETVVSVFPEGQPPFLGKVAKPVADIERRDVAAALAGEEHHH